MRQSAANIVLAAGPPIVLSLLFFVGWRYYWWPELGDGVWLGLWFLVPAAVTVALSRLRTFGQPNAVRSVATALVSGVIGVWLGITAILFYFAWMWTD